MPPLKVRVPVDPEYVERTTGLPVTDKFVAVSTEKTVALLPVTTITPVDAPNAMVRALALLLRKVVQVNSKPARSSVPDVSVTAPKGVVFAPKTTDRFVNVKPTAAAAAVADIVQTPEPELASNTTSSVFVGGPDPLAPPEDADQLVVLALSQVPVPPIQ
jgi:hypothetical protein